MEMLTAFHHAAWFLRRMAQDRDAVRGAAPAADTLLTSPRRASSALGAARRLAAWLERPRQLASRELCAPCCH